MFSKDFKAALVGIFLILVCGWWLLLSVKLNNARIAAGEKKFLTEYPVKAIQSVFVSPPTLQITQSEQVGWPGAPYQGKVYRATMRVKASTSLKLNPYLLERDSSSIVKMIHAKGLCADVKPQQAGLQTYTGDWGTHSPAGQLESHEAYVLALPDHTYCVFYQFRAD